MRISGAELVVRTLRAHGIDVATGLVGDHILPICDLLPSHGIRLIDVRHDTAAVHIADGLSRTRGKPGVVLTTGGPGFANSLPGLAVAFAAGSPVLHLSGRTELATEGMGGMQELDQIGLATPTTKLARLVRDANRIPLAIAEAFRQATAGRPGPVHLTIPLDVQQTMVDSDDLLAFAPSVSAPSCADPSAVQRMVDVLKGARRPVLIVGGAARYSVDPSLLRDLIECTGLPTFTVEQARGLISDRHALCFGYPDPGLNDAGLLIRHADVVVLLGKKQDFRVGFCRPPFVNQDAHLVQIDADASEIGRNRTVQVGIVGDLGAVVAQLTAAVARESWPNWSSWRDELEGARQAFRQQLEHQVTAESHLPIHPGAVFESADRVLPPHAALLFDVGDFGLWGRALMRAEVPGGWHWPGPLGHLGTMLPMAIGAKVARPDAPVICFCGDGAVGFYFMELDTAVRHGLPVVVVVGNDAAWGIDRNYQLAYYGRLVGTELRAIRYDELARTMGLYAELVERREDLTGAFHRAIAAGQPALLNIRIRSETSPSAALKIRQVLSSQPTVTA
jgi:thiamine pyrophosphate-dependent acetolactate synthase large subunit-like protein